KWSTKASPSVAGSNDTFLDGVSCSARLNCWAVGGAAVGTTKEEPIAEHWNGTKWAVFATPQGTGGGLVSVSCPGVDCLAVGLGGFPSALAERWNGSKWSITRTAPLPQGATSQLQGVSCVTSANCFAVGQVNNLTLIEHWLGSKWVRLKS